MRVFILGDANSVLRASLVGPPDFNLTETDLKSIRNQLGEDTAILWQLNETPLDAMMERHAPGASEWTVRSVELLQFVFDSIALGWNTYLDVHKLPDARLAGSTIRKEWEDLPAAVLGFVISGSIAYVLRTIHRGERVSAKHANTRDLLAEGIGFGWHARRAK